ncbi:MAG: DegT/DnrJ/EryC1/StrS family aminotransferase [Chloroflexi bacterium]|nr:DegT/DnrJ/EryC1/StrS family aminotransferase [Chloroflexota bacterium]
MTIRSIPFGKPWVTDEDRQAVMQVLQGDVLTHGPQAKAFEAEFAQFMGGDAYCVSLSSGMAALHLAYWQLGIGAGDQVIVTAQTHIATAHAVEVVGAQPVFVDCDSATGNIDPSRIERLITPRTKAIGLVHFLGIPCNMDAILEIASRHGLQVIEDCALAIGTRYKSTHVGLLGDAGIFSFYPVKHITTGDGGMFVSRHKELADKVSKARGFGVDRTFSERTIPGMYDVPTLGINYRLSDINAALGRGQLKRIDEILRRRRANFTRLKNAFKNIPYTCVLDSNSDALTSSHYCLSVVLSGPLASKRNQIVPLLNQAGIGTSVYYPQPVPRMTYYRQKYGYKTGEYPNAEKISDCSIALPVGPHLDEQDLEYIGQVFAQVVKETNQ